MTKENMRTNNTTLRVVNALSYSIIAAMLGVILYWIFTNSFEDIETIFIAIGITLLLAANLWMAHRGKARLAAWLLIGLLLFLNTANIVWYGIGSLSTAALLIPTVAAFIGLSIRDGIVVTVLSLLVAWGTVLAAATGQLKTELPYQISNLTFDAPILTVIFILVGVIVAQARE